jgi:predicted nucleic acid-binding Zn finger protein
MSFLIRQLLKMPRQLVNREELGKLITKTSGAISMITESHYSVRSISSNNTYVITTTKSEWTCSCPDYARHNSRCKHVYAVEFYRSLK